MTFPLMANNRLLKSATQQIWTPSHKHQNRQHYDYVKRCGSRSISEQFYSYFQWFVSPENSQAKRTTGYFTNYFVAFFFSLFFRHYWYCDEQNRFNLRPPRGSRWTTNTESCLNTAKQHE